MIELHIHSLVLGTASKKASEDLSSTSKLFESTSQIIVSLRINFENLRKTSGQLRKSSYDFGSPLEIFEGLQVNIGTKFFRGQLSSNLTIMA